MMDLFLVLLMVLSAFGSGYVLHWIAELEIERQHWEAKKPGWQLLKRRR